MLTTEQDTGRGVPTRRAVPKTGTRRSAMSHQPKPRPRTETRQEAEGKRSAAERERAGDGKRPVGERARPEGKAPVGGRVRAEGKAPADGRVRAEGKAPVGGRLRPETKAPTDGRTRAQAGGRTPVRERVRPGTDRGAPAVERPESGGKRPAGGSRPGTSGKTASRPAPRRSPARRQRAPFVLLVVGLLCGGLVSLLLLNTMLAQDAITDASLREEIAVAKQENEKIDQDYQLKTQPGVIAHLAEQQGQHTDWDEVNGWSSGTDQSGQVDTER